MYKKDLDKNLHSSRCQFAPSPKARTRITFPLPSIIESSSQVACVKYFFDQGAFLYSHLPSFLTVQGSLSYWLLSSILNRISLSCRLCRRTRAENSLIGAGSARKRGRSQEWHARRRREGNQGTGWGRIGIWFFQAWKVTKCERDREDEAQVLCLQTTPHLAFTAIG